MHSPLFNRFYAPPDTGGGDEKESDTFELLNVEDEPEVLDIGGEKKSDEDQPAETEEEDKEPEDGKEEEIDELKEIEEELEGPKEEDLELMTPVRRREILSKYPKLFKDFPYLEKAYYREQQFTEVFPTIQDARTSAEKARILDNLDQQVMNGNISSVLQAAKTENQEAFLKIADNYLPALRQVDQQAYYHVLGNVIKDTIVTMVREGRALGDQGAPLQAAANILNQFVFGSQNFTPPTTLSKQSDPREQSREQQYQQQEQQRAYQAFESVREELQTKADNVLTATIDGNIDPRGSMTDYVKQHAVKEAHEKLEDLLSKDKQFRGLLDRLWERAHERGYDKDSQDKIKSAYLSKAKTLLPTVIKKARNDALKGLGRRVDSDEVEEERSVRKNPITPGRSTAPSSGKYRKASDIPRGMSTLDVLMKD
jgi:hypothetical protein